MGNVSVLDQVGVALGSSTYGTASGSFTRGLLVNSYNANPPEHTVEPVGEIRGDFEVRRLTKGPQDYNVSLEFPLDVGDSASAGIGDFLAAILGTDTGTKVSTLYKHKLQLSTSETPPWLNLWSDKDATNRQIVGVRPTEIGIAIDSNEGKIPVSVSGIGKDESDLTSTQTLTFSDEPLIVPSNAGTFKVGGSSVDNFDSVGITIASDVERFRPVSNSRNISAAYKKNLRITLNLVGLNFTDETQRALFKANTSSSFELKLTDSGSNYIHFVFPEIYFQTWEGPNISGEDLKKITATALVTGDSTNWYVEIQNTYANRYDTGAVIS